MNNMIKIFENEEFGSLRILKEDNGRIMFCGKDVASALGYSNTKDAIRRHCRWGVKHDLPHPQSPSKTIKMIFIPEGDVYRLVAHSKLPRAAEFESWIFDKILPQSFPSADDGDKSAQRAYPPRRTVGGVCETGF